MRIVRQKPISTGENVQGLRLKPSLVHSSLRSRRGVISEVNSVNPPTNDREGKYLDRVRMLDLKDSQDGSESVMLTSGNQASNTQPG